MPFQVIDIKAIIAEELKDPVFAEHYARYALEYELIAQLVSSRKRKNMTQDELASRSGVKQQVISRLERHQVFPNLSTLAKLAKALDLKITMIETQ